MDITGLRLGNQHLIGEKFDKPSDVVSWLGAIQSQDFAAAKWALGMRMQNTTDADVEKAFNNGSILRTHVMRPTWHFVIPTEIGWMLDLTRTRVKALMGHYNRKLELTDELFEKCNLVIANALKGRKYLTRQEIAQQLENNKIPAHGQRLGHIVMNAELDSVICSGPRLGKQFAYALLEERVPKVKKVDRSEALSRLALKYFNSHGPAQIKDFAWWSGLTFKDAFAGLDAVKAKLIQETQDGKTYWFSPAIKITKQKKLNAFLLSIYDEYTIAYKDRSALGDGRYFERLILMGNALTSVIIIDGKIVGTWKRLLKKDKVLINASLFRKLDVYEKQALKIAANNYGKFLGLYAVLEA